MWLIENQPWIGDVGEIPRILRDARSRRRLTLVIGNGPSQSAAWLHGLTHSTSNDAGVSWSAVVKAAAKKMGLDAALVEKNGNNLALAQAVLVKTGDPDLARRTLVSALRDAFRRRIEPTFIDQMVTSLAPSDVVTTNYDFQLERAFDTFRKDQWRVFARYGGPGAEGDVTSIHKMHGSFAPGDDLRDRYQFGEAFAPQPERSIVITESDYDDCYRELGAFDLRGSSLMSALSQTCLIIGKAFDAQDISFMYALRKTRAARGKKAFMLFDGPLTPADQLNAFNLEITPLVMNLPRARSSGHYYYGVLAALAALFPDLEPLFSASQEQAAARFATLVAGPHLVAIGLASQNITGRTEYDGVNVIPPAGRRNLRYAGVEEHVGGSALTPLMIVSSLDREHATYRASLVSALGNQADLYSRTILDTSGRLRIDTDGVSQNQASSWHSTVLVHTSRIDGDQPYPGQRIFLDRGYDAPVRLDRPELEQLHAQLKQPNLRLVYLDKFLAAQHPPARSKRELDPEKRGVILQGENLSVLRDALERRPQIEIVYETGGGGSPFQDVEEALAPYVNVFTAGFPFFARVILHELKRALPESLKVFEPDRRWWEADFSLETAAIDALLADLLGVPTDGTGAARVWSFPINQAWLEQTGRWARRTAGGPASGPAGGAPGDGPGGRRWFVTTLHHRGALAIDLIHQLGWYCRPPADPDRSVMNTSGAGDSFRGALMYAMLCATRHDREALPRALWFATDVATERCRYFLIKEACDQIALRFGGRYGQYESRPLPQG